MTRALKGAFSPRFQWEVNRLLAQTMGGEDIEGPALTDEGLEQMRLSCEAGESPETFMAKLLLDPDLLGASRRVRFREQQEREARVLAEFDAREAKAVAEGKPSMTIQNVRAQIKRVIPYAVDANEPPLERRVRGAKR